MAAEPPITERTAAYWLRVSRGERQADVAAAAGVDVDTLSALERGLNNPKALTLARVAAYYGVDARELLEVSCPSCS